MNIEDTFNLQKIAIFPTDEQGRGQLASFQQLNRIIHITAGEMVNKDKKEPCLWVLFVEGLDPLLEQAIPKEIETNNDDRLPKTKRENKSSNKSVGRKGN